MMEKMNFTPEPDGKSVEDEFGQQVALFLQLVILQKAIPAIAKMSEMGMKEAGARSEITNERMREARENQIREARDAKARDPRNDELTRYVEQANQKPKGVNLERDPRDVELRARAFGAEATSREVRIPQLGVPSREAGSLGAAAERLVNEQELAQVARGAALARVHERTLEGPVPELGGR